MNRVTVYMRAAWQIAVLVVFFALPVGAHIQAADFYLSNPGIELRRLQICQDCGEPLVVTSIAPGAAVRCPKCQRVQRRLPDDELIIKVYQICPSCSQRLDVSTLKPHEAFRCGSCNFEQRVLPEAVYHPPSNAGVGRIPAEKTIEPAQKLLPPQEREIPEPIVPGLNAPEGRIQEDYSIEIEGATNSQTDPENKAKASEPELEPKSETPDASSPIKSSGAYLDLPEIDNDIEGNVSILVNGAAIYESSIMRRVLCKLEKHQTDSSAPLNVKAKASIYNIIRKEAEDELINEEIIRQEAEREELTATSASPAQNSEEIILSSYKTQLAARHAKTGTMPSSGDLLVYYNKNIKKFSYPDQVVLDSIVLYSDRTERRDGRNASVISKEIKEKLDLGVDFTLIASRYSEGPFHKEGGRIRNKDSEFISANFLIRPLRTHQYSLKSGDIFGPIELPTCILFIQIADIKHGNAKSFASVKDEVKKAVTQDSMDKAFDKWLATIRRAAVIEYTK